MTLRSTLRRTMVALPLAAAAMVATPSVASAQTVIEAEGNGTLASAQNLDGLFATASNPFVTNSATTPHVSIQGGEAESQFDFYKFSVNTVGATGIFDVDFGFRYEMEKYFDSELSLLDSGGAVLFSNDDSNSIDPGSEDAFGLDSFINYTFTSVGTYVLRVGQYNGTPGGSANNESYQLQVSLDNAVSAVPEASTWAMMLFGFGFMGFAMRRRSARALATA
jgi:hypothetical protein